MPIRHYRRDPRSEPQRRADEEVLASFERGDFLRVAPSIERAAIELMTRRQAERRQFAARLGVRLGLLRRAHGISQQQLARVLGTSKSNVSRLESGRDGGLTVERLVSVEEAIRLLAGRAAVGAWEGGLIHIQPLDRFRKPTDCLEAA
jgi:DNA-binding XRE family transcriptional regulator